MASFPCSSIVSLKEVPFSLRTNHDKWATKQLGPPRPNVNIQQISTKRGKSSTPGFSKHRCHPSTSQPIRRDLGFSAQGHFHTWPGGIRDRTTDLAVSGWPSLPPEPWSSHLGRTEICSADFYWGSLYRNLCEHGRTCKLYTERPDG